MTNHFEHPITAFAVTVGNNAFEYRQYYDAAIDSLHYQSIAPEQSISVPLGHIVGSDNSKLNPQIRALVFRDGTTMGDLVWVDAIRERRQRAHEMAGKVNDLLEARFGADAKAEDLLSDLNALQSSVDLMPLDEFRIVEDVQLYSAISTIDRASKHAKMDSIIVPFAMTLRRKRVKLQEPGSLVDKSGVDKARNTPVPPLPWGPVHAALTRTDASSYRKPRSDFKPALFHLDDKRLLSFGRPRLKFASTLYNCYFSWQDSVLFSDGCTVNGQSANQEFALGVAVGGYDPETGNRISTVFDNGTAYVYGTCWAGYTDCNGSWHDPGIKVGSIYNRFSKDDGTTYSFTWIMDSWAQPATSDCACTDPDPYGINVGQAQDSPYPLPMLYLREEQYDGCVVNYSP
jgi:hypothetical protein